MRVFSLTAQLLRRHECPNSRLKNSVSIHHLMFDFFLVVSSAQVPSILIIKSTNIVEKVFLNFHRIYAVIQLFNYDKEALAKIILTKVQIP